MDEKPVERPKKKKKRGRPSTYNKKYCKMLIKFFDVEPSYEKEIVHRNTKTGAEWFEYKEIPNNLPFFSRFADKIKVTRETLYEWAREHKEFSDALGRARAMREEMIVLNASKGLYNPMFSMFYLKNRYDARYKEKIETENKTTVTHNEQHAKATKKAKEYLSSKSRVPVAIPS